MPAKKHFSRTRFLLVLCTPMIMTVVAGTLMSCQPASVDETQTATPPPPKFHDPALDHVQVIISEKDAPLSVLLLRSDGSVGKIDAHESQYLFEGRRSHQRSCVIFSDPHTGKVWAGRETDFYIEDNRQILSVWMVSGGIMEWYESLIPSNTKTTNPQTLRIQFNSQEKYRQLGDSPIASTDLRSFLNPWFFCASPESSQAGIVSITESHINNGLLELGLKSQGGDYTARIWIDIQTKQVVKAMEDGKTTFPTVSLPSH